MKPESKRVSKTHTYAHGINSRNSKLKKKNCFDFTKLSEALNAAQEKGTVGAVVDNVNNALLLLIPFMTSVNSWR